ncbi:MAG: hypothetical protein KDK33_02365 [Leptospiraceae bacterium]|nr:hypothetical protein [Leptospiraceae bacterium]
MALYFPLCGFSMRRFLLFLVCFCLLHLSSCYLHPALGQGPWKDDDSNDPLNNLLGVLALIPPSARGTLDLTFGSGGYISLDPSGASRDDFCDYLLQSGDGSFLTGGTYDSGSSPDFTLFRLTPTGTLDTSFGNSGLASVDLSGGPDLGLSASFDFFGNIYMVGEAGGLGVAYFDANGNPIYSFSGNSYFVDSIGEGGVRIFPNIDGSFVVAATQMIVESTDFMVVRYLSDGSLDTSFGSGGTGAADFSSEDYLNTAVRRDSGGYLLAGSTYAGPSGYIVAIAAFDSSGNLDASFSGDGLFTLDLGMDDNIYALYPLFGGGLLAAGYSDDDILLIRLNADGSLDSSFGNGGYVTIDIAGDIDDAKTIVVQWDGRIILGGDAMVSGIQQFVLVRFNTDGSLDTSFGSNGIVTADLPAGGFDFQLGGLVLQPDGKVVLSGTYSDSSNADCLVARYE